MTDIAERTIDTPSRTLADPPPAKPDGNPGLIALPLIIAGATGLGLINTGIVNVAAAAVPILLSATAIGLLVTTIWSAALSQNVNATIYGTFFGFYGSYAVLSLASRTTGLEYPTPESNRHWRSGWAAGCSRSGCSRCWCSDCRGHSPCYWRLSMSRLCCC